MSIENLCQAYRSSSTNSHWKQALHNIVIALKQNNHPDENLFAMASCSLMMNDTPGYWPWLDRALLKLMNDPTARLDPLPVLPDYEELTSGELIDKYEADDGEYTRGSILAELERRYGSVINPYESAAITDLRERLKDVMTE